MRAVTEQMRSPRRKLNRAGVDFVRRYLLLLLAVAVSATLLLAYFVFHLGQLDPIWSNIVAEGVSALWIFVIIDAVLVRQGILSSSMRSEGAYRALVEFFPGHEDVPWADVIRAARRLTIVVHYYNRWAREHHEAFIQFFGRGGHLRLIMADPEDWDTLTSVHRHFFPNLTSQELRTRIAQTEAVLARAFGTAASAKASFATRYLRQALHYSFVLVDDRHLYLSVYEQFRGPVVRSSVFHLDLTKDASLEDYWADQLEQFLAKSRSSSGTPNVPIE